MPPKITPSTAPSFLKLVIALQCMPHFWTKDLYNTKHVPMSIMSFRRVKVISSRRIICKVVSCCIPIDAFVRTCNSDLLPFLSFFLMFFLCAGLFPSTIESVFQNFSLPSMEQQFFFFLFFHIPHVAQLATQWTLGQQFGYMKLRDVQMFDYLQNKEKTFNQSSFFLVLAR